MTLTLAAPGGTTYTNGTVSVQLQLQGDTPEQVELLVDDQPLTTLQVPYTFTWDTTSVAEGSHRLAARARIGDKTFASEVREVVVDRTPPQVVSRTPTPGAQDVWVHQPIQATFSEPLKASTLTDDSVSLVVSGNIVDTTRSISADGKSLTVIPSSPIQAPCSVQLTLSSAVTDIAGNSLSPPTSTWIWSHPISLSLGALFAAGDVGGRSTPASAPHMRLDPNGLPYVAWLEEVDPVSPFYNIYVRHWTGNSWEPIGDALDPDPLRLGGNPDPVDQVIQIDSSGVPLVAWIHYDLNYANIHVSRWHSNQWHPVGSPIVPVVSSNNYPPAFPSFRLDKTDTPLISWVQEGVDSFLYLNIVKWTGQDWGLLGDPQRIYGILPFNIFSQNAKTSLAIDRSGAPVIAWPNRAQASSPPEPHGILVRRWNGSQWESLGQAITARPENYDHFPRDPYLLLDASGRLTLAWSESDGTTYNVHVYRWNESFSEWEPMGTLLSANPGSSPATNPKLDMDGAGNMFVTWEESNPNTGAYEQHLRRWNGTAWESIGTPIIKPGTDDRSFAVDANGNFYFAWASGDILVHRYNK
ncbi:Ig-like domain-containing protein [Hyalangium sp.]|uniref:Ig-like domain-containing protein n=1 Tax=Hyalangium sp. TaxID=2028555 RepID=UPI00389AC8C1